MTSLLVFLLALSPAQSVRFDAASVKANSSGNRRSTMQWQAGGRFVGVNVPLLSLLSIAYQVPVYQFERLPDWVRSARFDINATAGRPIEARDRPILLRGLLEERFHVVTRSETRDRPIYELVLARSDGRLGPGLRPSTVDCAAVAAAHEEERPVIQPGVRLKCSALLGIGSISGDGVPLSQLTAMLSAQLERFVDDRTGLSGRFDIDLSSSGGNAPLTNSVQGTNEPPSLFTALQEQLGLKLESRRGPSPVTILEKIDMPEN
jgi:uncharacterized protein (TIGR03435 family)